MINFSSVKTVESKVMPGVTFVFRVITEAVRTRLTFKLANQIKELRDIRLKIDTAPEVPRSSDGSIDVESEMTPEAKNLLAHLMDELDAVKRGRVNPEYFKHCFVRADGICIHDADGSPIEKPTADQFMEYGPADLYQEIVTNIRGEAELSAEERQNLESPTTSAAEVAGPTNDTTAEFAGSKDCMKVETA